MARTSVIAIDIGANTVKLVQFALSSSETRLVRAGIASYLSPKCNWGHRGGNGIAELGATVA